MAKTTKEGGQTPKFPLPLTQVVTRYQRDKCQRIPGTATEVLLVSHPLSRIRHEREEEEKKKATEEEIVKLGKVFAALSLGTLPIQPQLSERRKPFSTVPSSLPAFQITPRPSRLPRLLFNPQSADFGPWQQEVNATSIQFRKNKAGTKMLVFPPVSKLPKFTPDSGGFAEFLRKRLLNPMVLVTSIVPLSPQIPLPEPVQEPPQLPLFKWDPKTGRNIPLNKTSIKLRPIFRRDPPSKKLFDRFIFFPLLPPELRLMIWEFARPEARIVRLKWAKRENKSCSNSPIPGMLHACSESRTVALKWYTLAFTTDSPYGESKRPSRVFFDFSSDYLYTGCEVCKFFMCDNCRQIANRYGTDTNSVDHVQRIILHDRHLEHIQSSPFVHMAIWFKDAKNVMILGHDHPVLNPDTRVSDLIESTKRFAWQAEGKDVKETYKKERERQRTPRHSLNNLSVDMNVEEIKRMEFAVTARTSKIYDFMEYIFEREKLF